MSKYIRSIVCVIGVSIFLFVGCNNGNENKEKQDSKDKEIVEESGNESTYDDNKVILDKQEYIDKMDTLDQELNTKLKDKLAGTTLEMREAESEIYTEWDKMLNQVYSSIIETLSEEEKNKLIANEEHWIEQRDKKADDAAKEVEGGTMEPLVKISSLSSSTKERCYELVNNYME